MDFCLDDLTPLRQAFAKRYQCPGCHKSVNAFCYRCALPGPYLTVYPQVILPCPLVIVKDVRELESKSTAVQARILAKPVHAIDYDQGILTGGEVEAESSVLLFPSSDALPVESVDWSTIKQIIVIDGTWRQAKAMSQSDALRNIKRVKLSGDNQTLFWRYQSHGPHCLSTIEAIRAIYRERAAALHEDAQAFDNLLWFFVHQYELIQADYRNNPERNFTSRHRSDYIQRQEQ